MTVHMKFRRLLGASLLSISSVSVVTLFTTDVAQAAACSPVSSTVGTDTVLKFTSIGTCTWSVPVGVTEVRALVIGGGGAGGKSTNVGGSGGGGAGAMVVHPNFSVSGTINVVVGAGAATQNTYDRGQSGSSSSLGSLVAIGGGGGGDWCDSGCDSTNPQRPQIFGADGGSGGGSGAGLSNSLGGSVTTQSLPTGATSYGNRGGHAVQGQNFHGAGGGGAGAAGADRTTASAPPTAGGIGRQSDITGVNTYYAGGGGGSGGWTSDWAAGGNGGGGNGGGLNNNPEATAGQANTGSGGGGGQNGPGGAGGSGVVIIRFATVPVNSVAPSISGTLQVGDVLSAATGTWSGAPSSYSYQWKRASTAGGSYTNVASASSSTYTLTDDDIGDYFKVEVNASNVNGGGTPVLSSSVGPVTDMPSNPTPTLSSTTSTNDGFTFSIANYSATYTYSFVTTSGSASQTSGLVTVTGMSPSTSSTITVRASRNGYRTASANVTGSSRVAATTSTVAPVLEIVVSVTTTSIAQTSSGQAVVPLITMTPTTTIPLKSTTEKTTTSRGATTTTSTTTTTTIPNNSGGTVAKPAPKIPSVVAGEARVTVGNTSQTATVTRSENQLVVSAGPLKATLGAIDKSGVVASLDDEGNVRLKAGDSVRIKLDGFEPGSMVEAWLFSTPALLGTVKVSATGTVSETFTLPREVAKGSHRIALVTKTSDGKPTTLTVGVMVGEWEKGANVTVWLIVLPIILAIAGALILPATRRRRTRNNVVN
jgi:hypothetical protein